MKAIIVYMSEYGHIEQMAGKIMQGLEEGNIDVTLAKASDAKAEDLLEYDGIILGSPVRMGSIGDKLKTFIESTSGLWLKAALQNRVGGAFVSGGNPNSGVEITQMALYGTLLELGLVMTGFVNDMPGYGKGANQWALPRPQRIGAVRHPAGDRQGLQLRRPAHPRDGLQRRDDAHARHRPRRDRGALDRPG